jgi:hypothetical protein
MSPPGMLEFAAAMSAGEEDDPPEDRRLEVRRVGGDTRLDAVGVALAQLLRPHPLTVSSSRRRRIRPRRDLLQAGSQRILLPSGARDGRRHRLADDHSRLGR